MFNTIKRKFHNLISDQKFSEILTGSAWAFAARVLATGLGMISNIIIARIYGAEVMGIVAVLNSFLLLVTIFTVLGTDTSILRLIPEHLVKYSPTSAFRLYRKTQFMVIGTSLFAGALLFSSSDLIADKVFSKPHISFYFAVAAVFVVFKSLMLLNTPAVRGLRLIKVFAFMQVLPQASKLILLLLLGYFFSIRDIPVYAFLGSFVVSGIVGWVIMESAFNRKMRHEDQVLSMPARTILSISIPMFMTATMTFAIGQCGVIMLGMFRSEAQVGYYAIAVNLATLASFVLSAINSMAAPKFSELYHSGRIDELFYVARKSAKLIFWSTTPLLLGLVFYGKPLLGYLFGCEFVEAYPAMVLLVIGQFVNSVSGSTGLFMNMTGRQNIFMKIILGAAITNIAINLLLTPKMGMLGSAVAAMMSIIFWNLATLLYIKIHHGRTIGYLPLLIRNLRAERLKTQNR